ncbi:MAG: ABC transporter permease, partial [Myxococcota bacterium]
MRYELLVSARHLKSKHRDFISTITIISILGVVVGVATLVTVVSVTGGFQEAFREKVLGINSHILVMKYGINFREYRDIIQTVEDIDGVEAASPFIFHEMMVSSDATNSRAIVLIKGIDPDRTDRVSDLPQYIKEGSIQALRWTPPPKGLPPSTDNTLNNNTVDDLPPGEDDKTTPDTPEGPLPGVILGQELAEKLRVSVDEEVMMISPLRGLNSTWAPVEMAPTSRRFRVTGVYRSGFHEYDTKLVMVDYRALQDFFNQGDVVTGIELRVTDVFAVGTITQEIKKLLPPGRFRTLDWREINRNLFTSLKLQKLVLAIILTFIVIVASFNIVSTLIMIVDRKRRVGKECMTSWGGGGGGG